MSDIRLILKLVAWRDELYNEGNRLKAIRIQRVINKYLEKNDAIIFKPTKNQLSLARAKRHARPSVCKKEEYNKHLLETYYEYEDLRRNANLCLNVL